MDTEVQQSHVSKFLWLVFLGLLIGLGAIGVFAIWPQLFLRTPTDVIIVKAVDGPIKVKPLDPGGAPVNHQGLLVIDLFKNGATDTDEIEMLSPLVSSPEPPPIDAGKEANSANLASPQIGSVPSSTTNRSPASADETDNISASKQRDGPAFIVQLAAFRSAEKANEIANLLSEKHSSRLDKMRLQTMRLDTGTNGIFFRVVSPPLARSDAETACAKLRRAGQDCFLRKFAAPNG